MANLTNEKREYYLEQTEQLYIMGVRTPSELLRNLPLKDFGTAKKYLEIVRRRIRNRYKNTKMYAKQLTRQLASLDLMEKNSWTDYLKTKTVMVQRGVDGHGKPVMVEEKVGQDEDTKVRILGNVLKIQERRAALLGMDAPKASMVMQLTQEMQSKQLGRPLTITELKETASVFNRINDELADHTIRKAAAAEVDGEKKPSALRTDLPAPLPDQQGTPVPQGNTDDADGQQVGGAGGPA